MSYIVTHKSSADTLTISQPADVSVAIGYKAFFSCEVVSTTSSSTTRHIPLWNITSLDPNFQPDINFYHSRGLPPKHVYNGSGLIVRNVSHTMDGSLFACCIEVFVGEHQKFTLSCSESAKLSVIGKLLEYDIYN